MKLLSSLFVGLGVVMSTVAGLCYHAGTDAAFAVQDLVPQAGWLTDRPEFALGGGIFLVIAGCLVQPPRF